MDLVCRLSDAAAIAARDFGGSVTEPGQQVGEMSTQGRSQTCNRPHWRHHGIYNGIDRGSNLFLKPLQRPFADNGYKVRRKAVHQVPGAVFNPINDLRDRPETLHARPTGTLFNRRTLALLHSARYAMRFMLKRIT